MSATVLIENSEVNESYRGLCARYRGRKEDYFALLYLMRRFKISIEEAASHVCFGGNAFALDSFYYDDSTRNLFLFQFKCSDDHLRFKESLERLALVGMQRVFAEYSFQENEGDFFTILRK